MEPLTYEEFKNLVRASRRAWHLELRDTYNVESEDEPLARFLKGEPDDYVWLSEWLTFIREVTSRGTVVQRARVVTEPHVDYTRWGLVIAPCNIAAGEDIRYLPRHVAMDIDLPAEDCWLLDDEVLVLSVFSEDGRSGGFARERRPDMLALYRRVRDQVWSHAIPFAAYTS